MKKIYTLILFASCLFMTASAQSSLRNKALHGTSIGKVIPAPSPLTTDTIYPPEAYSMTCDSGFIYTFQAPASGYIFGNNSYSETECAQKYYGSGSINEVLVWFVKGIHSTGNNSVMAKVYSISSTTGAPMTALGTSASYSVSSISSTAYTALTFSSAVNVTTSYAVSVVLPTSPDTAVVACYRFGNSCAPTDSLSWLNVPSLGGWLSVSGAFGQNTDLVILPVGTLTNTTGINEYSANGLSLLGAYPNPASDFTTIRYNLDETSTVSINVFDLTGRIVKTSSDKLSAGNHEIKISLKGLSDGNYYYTIKTDKAQLTSKFIVTK